MHRFLVRISLFLTTAIVLHAAVPLTDLVDDQTAFAVEITNVSSLKTDWETSSMGRAWADPQFQQFFAPLVAKIEAGDMSAKFKAETGRTPEELLNLATGQLLLVVPASVLEEFTKKSKRGYTESSTAASDKTGSQIPPVLIAVEVGKNAGELDRFLMESLEKNQEEIRHQTEKFGDVVVHSVSEVDHESDVFFWAINDGAWVLATRKEALLDALDAQLKGGRADALGRSPAYLAARAQTHNPAFMAYVNWQALYPALEKAFPAKTPGERSPNPFELDPATTMRALGLESLTSLVMGSNVSADSSRATFAMNYREQRGIFNLLTYRDGPVVQPDWVPANWFSVSSTNFSPAEGVRQLLTLLDDVNPMIASLAQGQLRNLNRQLGIDIERDLIGSMGEQFINAQVLPEGATLEAVPPHDELNQFFAINLINPDTFQRAFDAVKLVLGPGFEKSMAERDYLGRKLYSFTPPQSGRRGFTYSISDRWLFVGVGSAAPVEAALQALDSRTAGFFARDDVRDALVDVPGAAFSVQFQDTRVLISALCATLIKLQQNNTDTAERLVDPAARPTFETISRYWSSSVGYGIRDSDGLRFETELSNP